MGRSFKGMGPVWRGVILGLFWVVVADASPRFDTDRYDQLVPDHCRDLDIQSFEPNYQTLVMGIQGAVERGFTHEIPLARHDATPLWHAFKARVQGYRDTQAEEYIAQVPYLIPYFQVINENYQAMGFQFYNEGDILEILTLIALRQHFPLQEYFQTGGYEYHHEGQRVLGELDVLVGRRSDCRIFIVGEAKLGLGSLSHALEQLDRFNQFLHSYLREWMPVEGYYGW